MSGSHSALASTERVTGVQFEQYVADSRQRLFRFAVVLSGDTVLAGDLVADVLGKVFERWPQVSAADNVHAYVRRMLVNEFVSWQRRRARAAPHPEVGRLVDLQAHRTGSSVSDPAGPNAERSALLDDLSRLPARQRAAIVLRYYEDLSDEDIAAALGCRIGTVRSSISRGLATLRITTSHDRTTS